jgi:hypothetical protein
VNSQEPKPPPILPSPAGCWLVLMAELVVLMAILLNLLFKQANGQTVTA